MSFYPSISSLYDQIFPFNPKQKEYVLKRLGGKSLDDVKLLDVGCGTGGLALELAKQQIQVTGVDLDEVMIEKARAKQSDRVKVDFRVMDMLKIKNDFKCNEFDVVNCFGNTIVHLNNPREIEYFVRQVAVVTKVGGSFLLQLINYDRILDEKIDHLPSIENDFIRFERNYVHLTEKGKIGFETILTDKKTDMIIKNSIELYPMRKAELKRILKRSNFANIRFFGSFDETKAESSSIPLVVSCEKW